MLTKLTKAERKYMTYDEKALIKLFSGSLYGKTVTTMKGANMITKEKYQKELVRMWDSLRAPVFYKRTTCVGVKCEKCALRNEFGDKLCDGNYTAFEQIECIEKWSKEHPEKVRREVFFTSFDDVIYLLDSGKIDSSDLISIERMYYDSSKHRWKMTYFGFEQ